MAKKRARSDRTGVYFDFPDHILAALDARAAENRRTRTAELLLALEKHLGIVDQKKSRRKGAKEEAE